METIVIVGILFLVLGFVLIGAEILIPGFGFPGIAGTISLIVGVCLVSKSVEQGIIITIIVIVALAIMLTIILALLHFRKLKSPIILEDEVTISQGFINDKDLEYLIDKKGKAVTDLRPSGKGFFEGILLDVRSEGKYILKETDIKIVAVKGNVLMVREI